MADQLSTLVSLMQLANTGRGAAGDQTVTSGGGDTITEGGGGTSTTEAYSSPGDITALQALLGELGGANYQQVLESIFAQAGGKIPGFMSALQNSVGARSGGNSAVQGMLQKLLSETALQGQSQIADLSLRNANTRAQIGANIAQATKGTHQYQTSVSEANPQRVTRTPSTQITAPTKQPYGIGEMAGLLGLLSAGKGLYGELIDKGNQSPAPVNDSIGTPVLRSADAALTGGQINSDPWANSAPQLIDNNIFSFTDSPNYLSDTGFMPSYDTADNFSQYLSDTSTFDFGSMDYGSLFDAGSAVDSFDFAPAYSDYDFTDQFWY